MPTLAPKMFGETRALPFSSRYRSRLTRRRMEVAPTYPWPIYRLTPQLTQTNVGARLRIFSHARTEAAGVGQRAHQLRIARFRTPWISTLTVGEPVASDGRSSKELDKKPPSMATRLQFGSINWEE